MKGVYPTTLDQVRRAIQKEFPLLNLNRHIGKASYYWFSHDDDLGLRLCGCYTTTIGVARPSDFTFEYWLTLAREIMAEANKEKKVV